MLGTELGRVDGDAVEEILGLEVGSTDGDVDGGDDG